MKRWQQLSVRSFPIAIATLALVAGVACGGDSSPAKPTEQKPSTSSAGQTAKPAASPTSAQAVASPTSAPVAPAGPIKLVATNLLFDKKDLSAAAGAVDIEFDNQDQGVPHNLHVFNGKDATGASLGATGLEAGPVKQSLKVDLVKGQYYFQCDVHPTTMTGTIKVG